MRRSKSITLVLIGSVGAIALAGCADSGGSYGGGAVYDHGYAYYGTGVEHDDGGHDWNHGDFSDHGDHAERGGFGASAAAHGGHGGA